MQIYREDITNLAIVSAREIKNKKCFGEISENDFKKICKDNIGKHIIVLDDGTLKAVESYTHKTESDEFMSLPLKKRTDKSYLFSHLKYKFVDDNVKGELDLTQPLISIDKDNFTCDELLKKIQFYMFDESKNDKLKQYVRLYKEAKNYIRRVCSVQL